MTIEKLPSGNYRIKQMQGGKTYRVTVDHKPSKIEAMQLISEAMSGCPIKGSFRASALEYIENKRNILSPRTIKEYENYPRSLPEWFANMPMYQVDQKAVQRCINELAVTLSPKTVRNYHGFIAAVMSPHMTLKTTLPRVEKREPYIPTKNDYKALLEAFRGTQYHVVLQLMRYGLRRGEILALTLDDVEDDCVHVTKDMVLNSNNEWVVKPPKTTDSARIVPISRELAEEIRQQGYVYRGHPNNIEKVFRRTQDELGIPRFNPHKLRHLFASIMIDIFGVKTAKYVGGWKTSSVIESVYDHFIKSQDEVWKREIVDALDKYFE